MRILSFILTAVSLLFFSLAGKSQSESHNFITYDTTIILSAPEGGAHWNLRVTRPAGLFTAGDPDNASRPAIIFMVGSGETIGGGGSIGSMQVYGPHYWLNNGWDGGIQLDNGKHYPIIISVQPYTTGPTTRSSGSLLIFLINKYHIKPNGVHLTGLSMGAIRWAELINAEQTPGDETYQKRITSICNLSGRGNPWDDSVQGASWVLGDLPYKDITIAPYWQAYGHWAKKYNGKYFGLEGTQDQTQCCMKYQPYAMNDSVNGSAYYGHYPNGHCCWNVMYDPGNTNWNSISPPALGSFVVAGTDPNLMGTYHIGDNIFTWMLKQGDISLVGGGNQAPVVNAGTNQTITLPLSAATLTGTATDPDGSIVSHAWSQVSGASVSITSASSSSTTVTGMTISGTYIFRLTATDNSGATGTGDVTITVNNASGAYPTITVGSNQSITSSTTTIVASPVAANGIASVTWTKFAVPGQPIKKLTVIGSSTAFGNGATVPDSAFVNRLKVYYTAQGIITTITNLAVVGSSQWDLTDNNAALLTAALNTNPDVMLMAFPSNAYPYQTFPAIMAKFQQIYDSATRRGIVMYICGTQPRTDYSPADRQKLVTINDSLRLRFPSRFIDFLTPINNPVDNTIKPEYYSDGIHPNNAGHGVLAEKVKAANIFKDVISSVSSITSPSSNSTGLTGLNAGVHKFQASVTDNQGFSASAVIQVTVTTIVTGSETHNFITYDTTIVSTGATWNVRITRPRNMFTANHIDTASRPAIIFMVGLGEVGAGNFGALAYNGPHYWYDSGNGAWDGSITLGNGTHYPILISVSPYNAWPSTRACGTLLQILTNIYHIKRNSVHITGLSMGAMSWSRMMNAEVTRGDRTWMKLVKSMTCLQGQGNAYYDSLNGAAYMLNGDVPVTDGFKAYGLWTKYYGGKYFGLEGTNDYRDMGQLSQAMNDSMPGSAYRSFENIGGGAHCCWNNMYDPGATNWNSVTPPALGPNNATGYYSNTMGDYSIGDFVFKWMLKQGDTSLAGSGSGPGSQAPTSYAGLNTVITLPVTSITLNGTGTAYDGASITTYTWSQVSGAAATINTPSTASTVITGLTTAGARVFRLTVMDNNLQTGFSDILITVNAAATVKTIPGTIEAEAWNLKTGNQFAWPTADVSGVSDMIGLTNGCTFSYNVNALTTGVYTVNLRGATTQGNANFNVYSNGVLLTNVSFPTTGSWSTYRTTTSASFNLTAGAQTILLQSTNNDNCNLNWISFIAGNQSPTANAGASQTITLPATTDTLEGSGTDPDGSIASYAWTQVSGTAATIVNPALASTRIFGMTTVGSRVFMLTVTDNLGATASSNTTITVNAVITDNKTIPGTIEAETWDAKTGFQYAWPTADVSGVSDMIGLSNGCTLTYNVNVLTSGTYTMSFRGATIQTQANFNVYSNNVLLTNVSFPTTGGWATYRTITSALFNLTAGTQTIRLQSTSTDNCNLNWISFTLTNILPVAYAGANQTITLPVSAATLTGSGTDADGTITSYAWTQVSGAAVTIADPSSASTNISGITTAGLLVFKLVVTDNQGAIASSNTTITVNAEGTAGKIIPGRIEAEDWDTKSGYQYSIVTNDAGGGLQMVGISNGSWMDYNVNVLTSGTYTVGFRVATTQVHAQFQVKLGTTVLGTINIPYTGGWDVWVTASIPVILSAGTQTLRILSNNNESCDLNWIDFGLTSEFTAGHTILVTDDFSAIKPAPAFPVETTMNSELAIYPNPLHDQFVLHTNNNYEGKMQIQIIDAKGNIKKEMQVVKNKGRGEVYLSASGLPAGTYIIRVKMGNLSRSIKMIKW